MIDEVEYIYRKSFRHARTGKVIVHPTGFFRFPVRRDKTEGRQIDLFKEDEPPKNGE